MVISPYRYVSEEDLAKCILELAQQLSVRIYQAARRHWRLGKLLRSGNPSQIYIVRDGIF